MAEQLYKHVISVDELHRKYKVFSSDVYHLLLTVELTDVWMDVISVVVVDDVIMLNSTHFKLDILRVQE